MTPIFTTHKVWNQEYKMLLYFKVVTYENCKVGQNVLHTWQNGQTDFRGSQFESRQIAFKKIYH